MASIRVRVAKQGSSYLFTCKSTKTETRKNLPVLDKKGDEEKLDTDSVNSEESFDSFSQSHSYNSLSYLLLLSLCRALWRIFRAKMYFSPLK